jgi:predicted PurR-regulated permease PerM
MVLIVPVLANQFAGLVAALPEYMVAFEQKAEPAITGWLTGLPVETIDSVKRSISDVSGLVVGMAGTFVTNIFQSGMAFVQLLSLVLITPIVAFYLLRDWDRIVEEVDGLLPRAHANVIREQMAIINRTLAGFIRGQFNVCLLLGLYYALGLSMVGLQFGIVIGLSTGFLVIFPYVGLMLGMSIGLGVALFQFGPASEVLAVLAVFVSGQIIEGNFVTPKLVGDKVGLHPVWIIFGMLSGAALFGFVGVLLAVPATAVIGVLIRFALQQYLQSSYYQGDKKPRRA